MKKNMYKTDDLEERILMLMKKREAENSALLKVLKSISEIMNDKDDERLRSKLKKIKSTDNI